MPEKTRKFIVSPEDSGMRLDAFLAKNLSPDISRSIVKKLIAGNKASVNNHSAKPSLKLNPNDEICLVLPGEKQLELKPYKLDLDILYEDASIIVINKPAGLSVHPGAGNQEQTLVNALIAYTDKLSCLDPNRPGIVHRLDKDTSGVLVLARDSQAHYDLQRQFKERSVKKIYLAIVEGQIQFDEGLIDAPVAPDPRNRQRMKIDFACQRPARSEYKVLKRLADFTLVQLHPVTGRTHQLRVHMKYLGHPIVGDKKYPGRIKFNRLALHSHSISFRHPQTKETVTFSVPLPKELEGFVEQLESDRKKK
jgi:23S rRNA pseudouridine1911/1915/1917 synthase